MTPTSKASVAASVLLVVGVVLWCESGRRLPSPSRGGEATQKTKLEVVVDTSTPRTGKRVKPEAVLSDREPPVSPRSPGWRLRGRIVGFDSSLAPAMDLELIGVHRQPDDPNSEMITKIRADEEFDLDVSSLFARTPDLARIDVTADHPNYSPSHASVEIAEAAIHGGEWRVDIPLEGAAIAVGRVIDENGRSCPGVRVQLRPFINGHPLRREASSAITGNDGAFHLRAPDDGTFWVTAISAGWRPVAGAAELRVGQRTELPDLVLTRGCSISGRVRFADGRSAAGAALDANPTSPNRGEWLSEGLRYADGAVHSCGAEAIADTDGRFELSGLDAATYGVWARIPARRSLEYSTLLDEARTTITAPVDDVEIVLPGHSHIVVEVRTAAGDPLPSAMVHSPPALGLGFTEGDGRFAFDATPGTSYEIRVSKQRFEPATTTFMAPAAGEERVVSLSLQSTHDWPSLVVDVVWPDGTPVIWADVSLVVDDGPTPKANRTAGLPPSRSPDDRIRFEDVKPGRYRVHVTRVGEQIGHPFLYADSIGDLELPADGREHTIRVQSKVGGHLHAIARDVHGNRVDGEWHVRDANGDEVRAQPAPWLSDPYTYRTGGPMSLFEATVAAGDYTVECEAEGLAKRTLKVTVVAGETTNVDLTLERE
ncbi:MAG: hypothetical protein HY292_28075 [Planctomycetes bacterium]|nr:hypothetical protein [Planctomycetota bacterium]